MYMLEHLISSHPSVQKYSDEIRRISMLRHKTAKNKPWAKSNKYLKTKVVEHLATDIKQSDIFMNTFMSRDKTQEANFNLQIKADQSAYDVIFDSFILGDFLTFGKSVAHTRELLYMLNGIVLLPAITLCHKLTQAPNVENFGAIYNNDSGVMVAMVFASLGFLLRPLIHSEVHMTFYRK